MSIHLEDSIDLRANWVTSSHLIRVDFLELLLSVTHSFLMRKPTSRYNLICHQCFELVKELVRYIHLNPLRAKLVESVGQLDRYRWCGHSVLLGRVKNEWQDRDYVLMWFGAKEGEAKKAYGRFVIEGVDQSRRSDLVGGGLLRS